MRSSSEFGSAPPTPTGPIRSSGRAARFASVPVALVVLAFAACGGGDGATTPTPPTEPPPPPPRVASAIAVHAGDAQIVASGEVAPIPPAVIVRDGAGQPLAGVAVSFSLAEGGGTLEGTAAITDANGVAATTRWVVGVGVGGPQRITASAGALPPLSIRATIQPGTQALTTVVPAGGGTVVITETGHPYKGLRLTVPAGAFSSPSTWRMRLALRAALPTLPSGFRISGPALALDSDQLRAASLMTLQVPVPRAADANTVLVYYDGQRRVLEVLPTIARTDSSITVATAHLRPDLLFGRSSTASASATSSYAADTTRGLLLPIELPKPLPLVPMLDQARFRWPVQDVGSARFPRGFGLEISAMRFITAQTEPSTFALGDVVKPLQTPGFYLDAAPIAVTTRLAETRSESIAALKQFSVFRLGDKAARDELSHVNFSAHMLLTGQPALAALYGANGVFGNDDGTAFALAVGGSANGLSFSFPSTTTTLDFTRSASGFQETTVPRAAGEAPVTINTALPVSSFVFSHSAYERGLSDLRGLEGKTGAARRAVNATLSASAGLPSPALEYEAVPGGGWIPFDSTNTVFRMSTDRVRIVPFSGFSESTGALVLNFATTGAEIARASTNTLPVGSTTGFTALAERSPTDLVLTAASRGTDGSLKPIIPITATLTRAPFSFATDTSVVTTGFRLGVDASVPLAPRGGFRVLWNWGDGDTTETLNQTTASHIYGSAGVFNVVSKLVTSDASRATLAVDTTRIPNLGDTWVGSVRGQQVTEVGGGITHFEATNVRWTVDTTVAPISGWSRFRIVGGELSYYREVPCASWSSPVSRVSLSNATFSTNRLFISAVDVPTSGGASPQRRYYGQSRSGGPRVLSRNCPTPANPNPQIYEFGDSPIFFQSGLLPLDVDIRTTTDLNVLAGTFTQVSFGLRTTWTWRFERVR